MYCACVRGAGVRCSNARQLPGDQNVTRGLCYCTLRVRARQKMGGNASESWGGFGKTLLLRSRENFQQVSTNKFSFIFLDYPYVKQVLNAFFFFNFPVILTCPSIQILTKQRATFVCILHEEQWAIRPEVGVLPINLCLPEYK